uniref:Glyco_hydro_6 n=1 Tax=uncultured Capnocytophaga sp. TaxID=159273 RepID=A0A060C3D4_9FLAO|nr:Glyco_hydro_6 [uncultured Capnocytophaga sp.]
MRTSLLRYAASRLRTRAPQVAVYLHAGSGTLPMSYVVSALKDSGIANLRGFALNVSSHGSTAAEQAYGDKLVKRLKAAHVGTKHYIVDTSR